MATCKAWELLFKPSLWEDVVLVERPDSVPQILARNRYRIRSLLVPFNDYTNLHALADDLPHAIPTRGFDNMTPAAPDSLQEPCSPDSSSITIDQTFGCLRTLHIRLGYKSLPLSREQRITCYDYILRISNSSSGLTRITLELQDHYQDDHGFLSDPIQCFSSILANRLPCVQQLEIRADEVKPETALEFLRVCFNHPQLADLNFKFPMKSHDHSRSVDVQQLEAFLEALENDNQTKEASGKPAVGTLIKRLDFPCGTFRYPPNFICTLLKSHLPNIERFMIPRIYRSGYMSLESLFKDAVGQGCPKLQHIDCSYLFDVEAIFGVIKGCREWGLKSFTCLHFDSLAKDIDGRRLVEALVLGHSRTLETIDLEPSGAIHKDDFVNLISKCKNLKKVIIRCYSIEAAIEYQDVALQEWLCCDLAALEMTLGRPSIEPGVDEFNSNKEEYAIDNANNDGDDEGGENNRRRLYKTWARRKGKEAYEQIGRMTKLEELYLGSRKSHRWFSTSMKDPEYDLTLEYGWLGELAELKELKHLHMLTNFWSGMGQAEVEFMDAQWPKLEMITFNFIEYEDIGLDLSERHWQWLKERRPHLRYCCL